MHITGVERFPPVFSQPLATPNPFSSVVESYSGTALPLLSYYTSLEKIKKSWAYQNWETGKRFKQKEPNPCLMYFGEC